MLVRSMYKTSDDRFLVVSVDSPETSEQYAIDLRMLAAELRAGQGRLRAILHDTTATATTTARPKSREDGNHLMRRILQAQQWLKFEHTGGSSLHPYCPTLKIVLVPQSDIE